MAGHTDGTIMHPVRGTKSSHTFLLYLTDCAQGGETVFLRSVNDAEPIACATPRRGSLLVFAHRMPHAGLGRFRSGHGEI